MDQPLTWPIRAILYAVAFAAFASWVYAARTWRRGRSLAPYEDRRPVPWNGLDLLAILVAQLLAMIGVSAVVEQWLGPEITEPAAQLNSDSPNQVHQIIRALKENPNVGTLLLCVLAAVVVAPIVEEFLFRVVLQGFFEKLADHYRGSRTMLRWWPAGAWPILVVSLIFASLHFRSGPPRHSDPRYLLYGVIGSAAVGALTLAFGVIWLKIRARATWADLGWDARRFGHDLRLGLLSAAMIVAPLLYIQQVMSSLLPQLLPLRIAADPIPLFALSLMLGWLYQRTHRAVPSIAVHMSLNTVSLTIAWLSTLAANAAP